MNEVRKQHHAIGRGGMTGVETDNPVVVAYIREYTEESCWYSTAEAMPSRPRRLPRRIRGR